MEVLTCNESRDGLSGFSSLTNPTYRFTFESQDIEESNAPGQEQARSTKH